MLDFNKTLNGDEMTVVLKGRLDTMTAPTLEESLMENYGDINKVIFDCTDLGYISSAGLRVLLTAMKKTGEAVIVNASPEIVEILEVTGFIDLLTVL